MEGERGGVVVKTRLIFFGFFKDALFGYCLRRLWCECRGLTVTTVHHTYTKQFLLLSRYQPPQHYKKCRHSIHPHLAHHHLCSTQCRLTQRTYQIHHPHRCPPKVTCVLLVRLQTVGMVTNQCTITKMLVRPCSLPRMVMGRITRIPSSKVSLQLRPTHSNNNIPSSLTHNRTLLNGESTPQQLSWECSLVKVRLLPDRSTSKRMYVFHFMQNLSCLFLTCCSLVWNTYPCTASKTSLQCVQFVCHS